MQQTATEFNIAFSCVCLYSRFAGKVSYCIWAAPFYCFVLFFASFICYELVYIQHSLELTLGHLLITCQCVQQTNLIYLTKGYRRLNDKSTDTLYCSSPLAFELFLS